MKQTDKTAKSITFDCCVLKYVTLIPGLASVALRLRLSFLVTVRERLSRTPSGTLSSAAPPALGLSVMRFSMGMSLALCRVAFVIANAYVHVVWTWILSPAMALATPPSSPSFVPIPIAQTRRKWPSLQCFVLYLAWHSRYYVTGAPQCPYPDAYIGEVLSSVGFDAVYVQVSG